MAEEWVPINQIFYLNSNEDLDYPQMCDGSTGYVGDLTPKAEYLSLLNSSNLVRFHVDDMNGGGELQIYLSGDGQAGYGTTGEIVYISDFLGLTQEFLVSEIRFTNEYFTGLQVRTNYGDPVSPVALYIDLFLDLSSVDPEPEPDPDPYNIIIKKKRTAARVKVWNPNTNAEETLYFSNDKFITGATDTPAHTWFIPRIQQPGLIQRSCFSGGMTGGQSRIGYGETTIVNNDGALDYLINYGFDGREIVLHYFHEGDDPEFQLTLMTGTMGVPGWESNRLVLRIRDRLEDLKVELQTNLYAGDNVLPDGLEGGEELKGSPKPLIFGIVKNIPATLVNSSRLIYQVHDGAILDASVYDRGLALTVGSDYASEIDMETNAPAAGFYRMWKAGGYFRLGATPAGLITADVTQESASVQAGHVLRDIAMKAGMPIEYIDSDDVSAVNSVSDLVGVWFDQPTSALSVMDLVAAAAIAWYGFDEFGILRMSPLTVPSGTPIAELNSTNLQKIEVQTASDGANGVPPYRVNIQYGRNYSVQTTDLAGAVTADRRAWLAQSIRTVVVEDLSTLDAHPLSQPLTIETPIVTEAGANTLATRAMEMFGTRRDRVSVTVNLDQTTLMTLSLGSVVNVVYPRFGYNSGKLFRILSLTIDWQRRKADLELWG